MQFFANRLLAVALGFLPILSGCHAKDDDVKPAALATTDYRSRYVGDYRGIRSWSSFYWSSGSTGYGNGDSPSLMRVSYQISDSVDVAINPNYPIGALVRRPAIRLTDSLGNAIAWGYVDSTTQQIMTNPAYFSLGDRSFGRFIGSDSIVYTWGTYISSRQRDMNGFRGHR